SYSAASVAAFSEEENSQLASINQKSSGEVKTALDNLNKSVDTQISNNPDRKRYYQEEMKYFDAMLP
ncbi:TPA: hypothetical protein ACLFL9_005105, partial [Salmonella enterica subsp. diarizonae serovar 53:z10:z35]